MPPLALALAALVAAAAVSASAGPGTRETASFGPSTEVAAGRGSQIFNSVFDSLRKYGTAVHPNGMSLYLATVPQGVFFHHGNDHNSTPTTLDWLAYEIEHAEMFARPRALRPGAPPGDSPYGNPSHDPSEGSDGPPPPPPENVFMADYASQVALGDETTPDDEDHGWLHTYRTTRPLQFLYIDGMSGDKGSDGVIDTQDYLLRAVSPEQAASQANAKKTDPDTPAPPRRPPGPPGEFSRAEDLCSLCTDWDLQGVIRTEGAGTEIIKCDFFDGLQEVQSTQRLGNGQRGFPGRPGGPPGPPGGGHRGPRPGGPGGPPHMPSGPFNIENGFRDVGAHRTVLDYASMVSAFFFPVNLTNPDSGRAAFPRLVNATSAELVAIKAYLASVVAARRDAPLAPYSWRDVADLIVRRYQPQLVSLTNANATAFETQLRSALSIYTDYSVADATQRDTEARARCTTFYLQTKTPLETETDELLYAAFEAVTGQICNVLYDALSSVSGSKHEAAFAPARDSIKKLIAHLDWSVFEKTVLL